MKVRGRRDSEKFLCDLDRPALATRRLVAAVSIAVVSNIEVIVVVVVVVFAIPTADSPRQAPGHTTPRPRGRGVGEVHRAVVPRLVKFCEERGELARPLVSLREKAREPEELLDRSHE